VTPASTLERNASRSNLDFDVFATAKSRPRKGSWLHYHRTGATTARLSTMFGSKPRAIAAPGGDTPQQTQTDNLSTVGQQVSRNLS
jgi:hypothetical protein